MIGLVIRVFGRFFQGVRPVFLVIVVGHVKGDVKVVDIVSNVLYKY